MPLLGTLKAQGIPDMFVTDSSLGKIYNRSLPHGVKSALNASLKDMHSYFRSLHVAFSCGEGPAVKYILQRLNANTSDVTSISANLPR